MPNPLTLGGASEIKSNPGLLARLRAPGPRTTPEQEFGQKVSFVAGQGGYAADVVRRQLSQK